MKKILVVSAIVLIIFIMIYANLIKIDDNLKIKIIQYETMVIDPIKEINISSSEEIKKISKFVDKLKPLSDGEYIDLAIMEDVKIFYGDNIEIVISLSEKNYCYYKDSINNISTLSYMPEGLLEFVIEKLK